MALLKHKPKVVEPPPAPKPTEVISRSNCAIPGCTHCQPHKVYHWMCAQCQGGPFKFQPTDPGKYKVLRPHFERTSQHYDMNHETGVGRWIYTVRRVCSPGCWQREARRVSNDEAELATRRPDLAPAIQAKLEAEQDTANAEAQDDMANAFPTVQPDPGQY